MARWAKEWDECRECLSTRLKHAGKGLCRTCWRRDRNSLFEETPEGRFKRWLARGGEAGVDGWSDYGRWCGDGSAIDDGCGAWQWEHVASGLCGECCLRYSGVIDVEPRDVRLSREVTG